MTVFFTAHGDNKPYDSVGGDMMSGYANQIWQDLGRDAPAAEDWDPLTKVQDAFDCLDHVLDWQDIDGLQRWHVEITKITNSGCPWKVMLNYSDLRECSGYGKSVCTAIVAAIYVAVGKKPPLDLSNL